MECDLLLFFFFYFYYLGYFWSKKNWDLCQNSKIDIRPGQHTVHCALCTVHCVVYCAVRWYGMHFSLCTVKCTVLCTVMVCCVGK